MVRLWCISYKKIVACEVKELLQWCCGVAEAVKEYGKLGRDWWSTCVSYCELAAYDVRGKNVQGLIIQLHTFESKAIEAIVSIYLVLQVRYSSNGDMYVTASKDGAIRLWDGVTANCVRSIVGAHGTAEATSASFTKDQRFVLSCGKDSSVKLWEIGSGKLVKQYLGAAHTQLRCQAVFNETEEFVLSIDEQSNEIVVWDALTAEIVARLPSNHIGAPRWLEHSPTEAAFVSCGTDRSVRFGRKFSRYLKKGFATSISESGTKEGNGNVFPWEYTFIFTVLGVVIYTCILLVEH
ncbi:Cleavage stimulation factor subunit 50 [Vitis vinifera]|uniref:Cleavage stimulation factor 50 kDa subunit n=1 Tax=Vitis vinifera TaxID=29760 RepID=A0A438I3E7_VITVI|nr:Cleavage stimulation factor subunit 50 [Vitis vinifera]